MNLDEKVALVTGAAHRVGREIALGLAGEGASVALHYHRSREKAEQTLSEIHAGDGRAFLVQGDFSDVNQIEKVVESSFSRYGRLDVLINNAAIYFQTPFTTSQPQDWDRLFGINLKAPYFCSKFAAAHMQRGKIINISDIAAFSPWPDYIPYCTSKAGLIAMTKGLAKTLAPHIQVNAIASGTVLLQQDASEDQVKKIENETLAKKIGRPRDIVETVLFLIKGGDYVTGEVIKVDGGASLRWE